MLIFRLQTINRQVSLPHQLAPDVVPYAHVLTVRRTQRGFAKSIAPIVVFKRPNARRPRTGHQKKQHSSYVKGFLHPVCLRAPAPEWIG